MNKILISPIENDEENKFRAKPTHPLFKNISGVGATKELAILNLKNCLNSFKFQVIGAVGEYMPPDVKVIDNE